jgi:alkylation response protein AidB-like acyl-CoA dehydrogenase
MTVDRTRPLSPLGREELATAPSAAEIAAESMTMPPDALAIRRIARTFTREVLEPAEAFLDTLPDPADVFTHERFTDAMRQAWELGLTRAAMPVERGGLGLGVFAQLVLAEELAAGAPGLGSHVLASGLSTNLLLASGNYRRHPDFAAYLESRHDPATAARGGAWAATEPGLGADILTLDDPATAYGTTATQELDHFVISGEKSTFVSNAYCADAYVVMASVEPGQGMRGCGAFFVPADTPGITVGAPADKLGLRALNQAPVTFTDVRVPLEFQLVGPGESFISFVTRLTSRGNLAVGLQAIGVAQRAYERALEHARTRRQGGKVLIEHQLIATKLVTAYREITAARAMAYRAAHLLEVRQPDTMMCFAARVQASTMAIRTVEQMLQVFGASGVLRGSHVERYYRDVKLLSFADAPVEKVGLLAASML